MSDRRRLSEDQALSLLLRYRQRRNHNARMARQEQRTLRRLLARLGVALGRVSVAHVERLLAARLAEVRPRTVARELGHLRALYRVLLDAGHVTHDPTEGLRVRLDRPRRLLLSERAVQRLLREAARAPQVRRSPAVRRALGLRNRVAVELLYGLGLRASELCATRLIDLDLAQRSLLVRRAKGGESARLPLPPALLPHLERYLHQGRPVLGSGGQAQGRSQADGLLLLTEQGRPLTPDHLWRLVTMIAERAGLEAHPHALRRSLATHLVRRGASLVAVQRLLGHKSLDTTSHYVLLTPGDLRAAVETLSPGGNAGS